jgi:hypothetical protein
MTHLADLEPAFSIGLLVVTYGWIKVAPKAGTYELVLYLDDIQDHPVDFAP